MKYQHRRIIPNDAHALRAHTSSVKQEIGEHASEQIDITVYDDPFNMNSSILIGELHVYSADQMKEIMILLTNIRDLTPDNSASNFLVHKLKEKIDNNHY